MSSGVGASASAGPGTPVGGVPTSGGDPFGPLIASLNALDSTLTGFAQNITVTAVLDSKQFDATAAFFTKEIDITFTRFIKSFDTSLNSFMTSFSNAIKTTLAGIGTGSGGGGGGGGGSSGGNKRDVPRDRLINPVEAEIVSIGDIVKVINETLVSVMTSAKESNIEALAAIAASRIDRDKAVKDLLISSGHITVKTTKSVADKVAQTELIDAQKRVEIEKLGSRGIEVSPLNSLQPSLYTVQQKIDQKIGHASFQKKTALGYNLQTKEMGLPAMKVPGEESEVAKKGFDVKGMAGAAGLGILFASAGVGIGLLAAKVLGPSFKKAFDPLMKAAEDTASALDPFAEAVNTSLTPIREFGNEVKRWSIVAGMAQSFNMKRTNAEAGGNLNKSLEDTAKLMTGVFASPMTGILAAADAIGKFVEMADPAAMAVYQQTMRDTFAVIGNALKPAMIELSKMLRLFADDFNVVLQSAMPTIISSLQSLAKAFQDNLPNIILLMERHVNDLVKMVGGTGGGQDWKRLKEGYDEFAANGMKAKNSESNYQKFRLPYGGTIGASPMLSGPTTSSLSQDFLDYAANVKKISGAKGSVTSQSNIDKTLKMIETGLGLGKKAPSTIGMARPENAAYSNVADVGREAVRRAFEGSRQQDLVRQQTREDITLATKQGVIDGIQAAQATQATQAIYDKRMGAVGKDQREQGFWGFFLGN